MLLILRLRGTACKISTLGLYVLSLYIRHSVESVIILSKLFFMRFMPKQKNDDVN